MTRASGADRYVYFIRQVGQRGPVKVGLSHAPETRAVQVAEWSPYPLEVAATMPGDWKLERQFHAYFLADHSHQEWFLPSERMDAVIEAVRAGSFDVSVLPIAKGVILPTNRPARPFDSRIHGIRSRLGRAARTSDTPLPADLEADYTALKEGAHADPLAAIERLERFIEQARRGAA